MERINWDEPRTPKNRECKDRPKRKPTDPLTWQDLTRQDWLDDWLDELKSEAPVEDNQTNKGVE